MAQVKVAGDTVRSHQDCADIYSDMATVSSSAGESAKASLYEKLYSYIYCHQTPIVTNDVDSSVTAVTERLSMKCYFNANVL